LSSIDTTETQLKADYIQVTPGSYPEQVVVPERLHVFAPADEPRPVITSAAGGITFEISDSAAGTTVDHLDIRGTGPDTSAPAAFAAVRATDLASSVTADVPTSWGMRPRSSLRDARSLFAMTGIARSASTSVTNACVR
jgi:hypothetical protein